MKAKEMIFIPMTHINHFYYFKAFHDDIFETSVRFILLYLTLFYGGQGRNIVKLRDEVSSKILQVYDGYANIHLTNGGLG